MRIHLDITHPAHANFLRWPASLLRESGHSVSITCLRRGRLPLIVKELFPGFPLMEAGTYRRTLPGMLLGTGIARLLTLTDILSSERPDVLAGVAVFQPALLSGLLGFQTVATYDDPEHRLNYDLTKRLADTFLVPECMGESDPSVRTFRGLKEWAYLNPDRFTPDPSVPVMLGLEPFQYLFIRSIDTASMNYREQESDIIEGLYREGLSGRQTLLSLERKETAGEFPLWRILEEPVKDIHSLMYYSKMVLSSGDSMAREGAELGVPSIYCGTRDMKANSELMRLGLLTRSASPDEVMQRVNDAWRQTDPAAERRQRRDLLNSEWDDPGRIFTDLVMETVL